MSNATVSQASKTVATTGTRVIACNTLHAVPNSNPVPPAPTTLELAALEAAETAAKALVNAPSAPRDSTDVSVVGDLMSAVSAHDIAKFRLNIARLRVEYHGQPSAELSARLDRLEASLADAIETHRLHEAQSRGHILVKAVVNDAKPKDALDALLADEKNLADVADLARHRSAWEKLLLRMRAAGVPERTLSSFKKIIKTMNEETDARTRAEKAARTEAAELPLSGSTGLSVFLKCGADLENHLAQAARALVALNEPPHIFRYGKGLARVADTATGAQIDVIDHVTLMTLMAGVNWREETLNRKENDLIVKVIYPKEPVLKALVKIPPVALPRLTRIVSTPMCGKDLTPIVESGYDAANELYADLSHLPGELPVALPDSPTQDEVSAAVDLLFEVVCDFPFVSQADRANTLAAELTPFCREAFDLAPAFISEAGNVAQGKSLLFEAVLIAATAGKRGFAVPPKDGDDAEIGKLITTYAMEGRSSILWDNLPNNIVLDSPTLAGCLTTVNYTGRVLGSSKMPPVMGKMVHYITGNNPRVSDELARRIVRIRLDPAPGGRTFKHPNLLDWMRDNYGRIVGALFTLVANFKAQGCPAPSTPPLESFGQWTRTIGGILECAGVKGFLGNRDQMVGSSDASEDYAEDWAEAAGWLWERYGSAPFKPSDAQRDVIDQHQLLKGLFVKCDGEFDLRKATLGRALGKRKDRMLGDFRLSVRGDQKRGNTYSLSWEPLKPGTPAPPTRENPDFGHAVDPNEQAALVKLQKAQVDLLDIQEANRQKSKQGFHPAGK